MTKKIIDSIKDIFLNFNEEIISFTIQRITGILLTFYLFLHIFVLSTAIKGSDAYDRLLDSMENPFTIFLEILLTAGVAFHLFNGIRIVLVDFFPLTKIQKKLFWASLALSVIVTAFTVGVYLGHISALIPE